MVLEYMLRSENKKLLGFDNIDMKETVAVACWYLWWMRRRRTHNEEVPPLYRCKISILSITANATKCRAKKYRNNDDSWERPESRQLKLNVDASYYHEEHVGAMGAILRDHTRSFIAATRRPISHVSSVAMGEAMAMKEGLALALRLGCNSVHAESDSSETIAACNGSESWWSEPAAIYADCIDLSTSIGSVIYNHIFRGKRTRLLMNLLG
jgi:hypothetical protein